MWTYFYSRISKLSLYLLPTFESFCETICLDDKETFYKFKKHLKFVPALLKPDGAVIEGIELYKWINENKDPEPELIGDNSLDFVDNMSQPFQEVKLKSSINVKQLAEQITKERDELELVHNNSAI